MHYHFTDGYHSTSEDAALEHMQFMLGAIRVAHGEPITGSLTKGRLY